MITNSGLKNSWTYTEFEITMKKNFYNIKTNLNHNLLIIIFNSIWILISYLSVWSFQSFFDSFLVKLLWKMRIFRELVVPARHYSKFPITYFLIPGSNVWMKSKDTVVLEWGIHYFQPNARKPFGLTPMFIGDSMFILFKHKYS